MAILKYRLFMMFLTTYYIFDSVFATPSISSVIAILSSTAVKPLENLGFNGELDHDLNLPVEHRDPMKKDLIKSYKAFLNHFNQRNEFLWFYAIKTLRELDAEFNKKN
ncbi:uncharacterized protein LOC114119247 isoform X1 [Aphis gossypii]|uniref:uncharacterized protein LOC114119247 isoform X1 n=1 Tax=Aphis gossypii TaxID=80765 RepID=UPI0021597760|nr:uncharacterized protein LOC114119247 isoform X1 [Aphis gossypii]